MGENTKIKIVDVFRPAKRNCRIALVQILEGSPRIGMEFRGEDGLGSWKVLGFASSSCPDSMNLDLMELQEETELRIGMHLVESVRLEAS